MIHVCTMEGLTNIEMELHSTPYLTEFEMCQQ